jgi:hypothetical protein
MKRVLVLALLVLAVLAGLVWMFNFLGAGRVHELPPGAPPSREQAARGAYLARIGNCMLCHTERGGAAYAGGRPLETPFGTVYAGNITPDATTGIGRWSAAQFRRALHEGRSRARGGYHRIGKRVSNGAGAYTIHRADHWLFDGTGLDYGDLLGADAVLVGYECDGCDFTYRDGLPYPTGSDGTPEGFEILGTAPAAHFTRTTATRPPPPDQPSEVEFIAARLFGTRDPEAVERISYGHAVLGTYTSPSGGTVITSGSTDWAHGLAAHDPQVEQITRNLLDRLG